MQNGKERLYSVLCIVWYNLLLVLLFLSLHLQFGALTPLEPRLGKKLIEPLTNLIHRQVFIIIILLLFLYLYNETTKTTTRKCIYILYKYKTKSKKCLLRLFCVFSVSFARSLWSLCLFCSLFFFLNLALNAFLSQSTPNIDKVEELS